ncbi:MAG: o-succinylbenzoate--CoA ligase [Anaerolineae bacterium]
MQDWLTARANATPDRLALVDHTAAGQPVSYTYRDLNRLAGGLAAWLAAQGVQPGDRVAALLDNSAAYVALIHAIRQIRAVLVPLNTRLVAHEIAWQVAHVGCHLLVYAPRFAEAAAQAAIPARPVPALTTLAASESPQLAVRLESPAAIVFTSGTTGHPKGALLTHGNLFHSAMASAYRLGVLPTDRWLCSLPLYHVGGLSIVLRSCLYGTAIDLLDGFDAERVDALLRQTPITLVSLVPTMLYRLLAIKHHPWHAALRLLLIGGAALSTDLAARALADGLPIATTYGLTEAASQVATALPDEVAARPGTVGKPLIFTSVTVVDEAGNPLPPDEIGEIVVSGPTVMAGYFHDLDTLDALPAPGPLRTGDLGRLDAAGNLWLVQRRSDLIVSGGENVYPAEVENVLLRHPAIQAACVVGVPHPEWGQQVAAAIVRTPGRALTAEEVVRHVRQHLAGYKQPRRILFVDALPQTASGKINRRSVMDLFDEHRND